MNAPMLCIGGPLDGTKHAGYGRHYFHVNELLGGRQSLTFLDSKDLSLPMRVHEYKLVILASKGNPRVWIHQSVKEEDLVDLLLAGYGSVERCAKIAETFGDQYRGFTVADKIRREGAR